jgi:hypothetical protein
MQKPFEGQDFMGLRPTSIENRRWKRYALGSRIPENASLSIASAFQ